MNKIFFIFFSLVISLAIAQTGGGYTPPSGGSSINVSDSAWGLIGNSNTNNATNFIGTTNNVGLSFRTNNVIRQTIDNNGNVGIGTTTPIEELHIKKNQITPTRLLLDNIGPVSSTTTTSFALGEGNITQAEFRRFRDGSGKAEIGNIQNAPLNLFTTDLTRMTILGNGNVGIGITTPTSNIHITGSEAGSITNITATTALNATHHKILVSNAAVNITITLPDALTCLGREYVFSRAAGSTGSITIVGGAGNLMQALNGAVGATTSIGLHSATGGGLRHSFTAVNIGGVGVWVRL